LFGQVRNAMRLQHYPIHTERSYLDWIKRYVQFHQMTRRADLAVGSGRLKRISPTWQ
jgi:hypothetical protein